MNNTLVSARVPQAKKERASSILASIGATASDLINSAYDYVIETKQLPTVGGTEKRRSQKDFAAFVEASTLNVEWPEKQSDDYKSLAREWRRADYESLA